MAACTGVTTIGTLKTELLHELPLQLRSATRAVVAEDIDDFYNVRRRHASLDSRIPLEFELRSREGGGGLSTGASPPDPRSFLNEEEARKDRFHALRKVSTESRQTQCAGSWYVEELIDAQFIGHLMSPHFQDATAVVEDHSTR